MDQAQGGAAAAARRWAFELSDNGLSLRDNLAEAWNLILYNSCVKTLVSGRMRVLWFLRILRFGGSCVM